jgi:hypothetical protein
MMIINYYPDEEIVRRARLLEYTFPGFHYCPLLANPSIEQSKLDLLGGVLDYIDELDRTFNGQEFLATCDLSMIWDRDIPRLLDLNP